MFLHKWSSCKYSFIVTQNELRQWPNQTNILINEKSTCLFNGMHINAGHSGQRVSAWLLQIHLALKNECTWKETGGCQSDLHPVYKKVCSWNRMTTLMCPYLCFLNRRLTCIFKLILCKVLPPHQNLIWNIKDQIFILSHILWEICFPFS